VTPRLAPALAAAPLFLLLGAAAPARAGTLTVEFDFTGSSFSINGLVFPVSIPPNGSFTAAGAVVHLPAAGPLTPSNGPASLESFGLDVTVDLPVLSLFTITGNFSLVQSGLAAGTFNAANGVALIDQALHVDQFLRIGCTAASPGLCPPPIQSTINEALGILTLPIAGLSVNGAATIISTITVTTNAAGTVTGMFHLVGTEVSRTFVPEPPRGLGLAAGGVALVALAGSRRRRGARRARSRS